MKYIPAEKLIAEIESRLHCNGAFDEVGDSQWHYDQGMVDAYKHIKEFITSLQQEQLDLPSGEDVMLMCNQILIDWVKEGKTQKEKEQREQAHIRFFELYDDYLMREQPEVDLEKELKEHIDDEWSDEWSDDVGNWIRYRRGTTSMEVEDVKEIARHFYELGLNARKEE